jgi:hypothetical protein
VFATDRSPRTLLRDLFHTGHTMAWVFWHSPDSTSAYASTSWSRRTPGMRLILAPRRPGQYYMALTGRLRMTALEWRRSWNPPLVADSTPDPTPTPEPAPGETPTPDPGVSPTPDPLPSPSPEPIPGEMPTPEPSPAPTPGS